MRLLKELLIIGIVISPALCQGADDYGNPIPCSYESTIVGTPDQLKPELPREVPVKQLKLEIFPDRNKPDVFSYEQALNAPAVGTIYRLTDDISTEDAGVPLSARPAGHEERGGRGSSQLSRTMAWFWKGGCTAAGSFACRGECSNCTNPQIGGVDMKRTGSFRRMFRPIKAVAPLSACTVLCLAMTLTGLTGGCRSKEQASAPQMPVVTAITVVAKDTPVSQEYIAQTESSHLVNVYARVTGFLERRTYTEGSLVKAGQVLFLMDKKPFQTQVDAAAAALTRQKAALQTARLNLARTRPLTARKAVSQKDLDDATGAYESSAAQVEQAGAQLETARLNLSYCTIASPISGITSAALQQDGTYINQMNSKLTTVAALSPMWVNFSLSENELAKYRDEIAKGRLRPPGDHNYEVEVVLVDGSLFPHTGRITYAAPSYNSQTGTFQIRASVANPDGVLMPNQFVRVRVKGAIRPNAILVPQRAVQQGAKGHFVWVVNREGKAESRPVVVGDLSGNDWFITEGLRAGDQVVVDGGLALRPGVPVTVKPLDRPPGPGSAGEAKTGS